MMWPLAEKDCKHTSGAWGGGACSNKPPTWTCHGCGKRFMVPPHAKKEVHSGISQSILG